jgi:hypothetical protein
MAKVINIYRDSHLAKSPDAIYIGRPRNRKDEKRHFGNIASHLPHAKASLYVATREEALQAYTQWLDGTAHHKIEPERRQWILENLHLIAEAKYAVCYCAPSPCHGDDLVLRAEQNQKQKKNLTVPKKTGNTEMTTNQTTTQEPPAPTPQSIQKLEPNQVFVFGSNLAGFHGAGAAGYALKGTSANDWRTNEEFTAIKNSRDKKGRWAVLNQGKGFQQGNLGKSYAIPTAQRPGYQGSITIQTVLADIVEFCQFAQTHPELEFLVTKFGLSRNHGGYSFFTPAQIKDCWETANQAIGIPHNVRLPEIFEVRKKKETDRLLTESPGQPTDSTQKKLTPISLAVIGTAGRNDDAARLYPEMMVTMRLKTQEVIENLRTKGFEVTGLVSGGAAWADHVAVELFNRGIVPKLTLHLPAPWQGDKYQDNGTRNFRTNPGGTANYYHRLFSSRMQRNTLGEIQTAINRGATIVPGEGLYERNRSVSRSDAVIAMTFGDGPTLKEGGTADTMGRYLDRVTTEGLNNLSFHLDLTTGKIFEGAVTPKGKTPKKESVAPKR